MEKVKVLLAKIEELEDIFYEKTWDEIRVYDRELAKQNANIAFNEIIQGKIDVLKGLEYPNGDLLGIKIKLKIKELESQKIV